MAIIQRAVVSLMLVAAAQAWPFCDGSSCLPPKGGGPSPCDILCQPPYTTQSSYCMDDPTKPTTGPWWCHNATADMKACGQPNQPSSVPPLISQAATTIAGCEAAGKGTATFCSENCTQAFATYISYGDKYACFKISDTAAQTTFYKETRAQINAASDTSGCNRTCGGCTSDKDCNGNRIALRV